MSVPYSLGLQQTTSVSQTTSGLREYVRSVSQTTSGLREYVQGQTYVTGDIVVSNGVLYTALSNVTNTATVLPASGWSVTLLPTGLREYVQGQTYATGEIVISNGVLYTALSNVTNTATVLPASGWSVTLLPTLAHTSNAVTMSSVVPTSATSQLTNTAIFFKVPGSDEIRLQFKAADGQTFHYTVALNSIDTAIPFVALTIQLNGSPQVSITQGGTYIEQGAVIYENGVSTNQAVTIDGNVNVTLAGTYQIRYRFSNATTVYRTVTVVAPTITILLNGADPMSIVVGSTSADFVDPGAIIYSDNVSTGIAATASGVQAIDYGHVSTNLITYSGQDSFGNQADPITRTVNVVAAAPSPAPPPVQVRAGTTPTFSYDFTSASKAGTNLQIGGNGPGFVVGTLGGTDTNAVTITSEGISTTPTSYVSLNPPTTPFGGNFSWEFVFKYVVPPTGQNYNGVIGTWNGGFTSGSSTHNIQLERDAASNKLLFWTYGSGTWGANGAHGAKTTTDVLGGNTLMHVVVTHTSGASVTTAKKMYINGSDVLLNHVWGDDTNVPSVSRSEFAIGRTAWGTTWDNGVEIVKYFRNYNSVLTQSEVTALYNAYSTPTLTSRTTPTYTYDFIASGVSFSDPTLTFADNTTGTSVIDTNNTSGTGGVTWNSTGGLTTIPNYALSVPTFSLGGSFSIEVVFKFDTQSQWNRVFGFGNNIHDSIILARYSNTNSLWFDTGNGSTGRHTTITAVNNKLDALSNTFVHVVVSQDSTHSTQSHAVYIDGQSVSVTPYFGGAHPHVVPTKTRPVHWVGRDHFGDEGTETVKYLKYYNSLLTQSEITALYNAALPL